MGQREFIDGKCVLTQKQIERIKQYIKNTSTSQLAIRFSCSAQTIRRVAAQPEGMAPDRIGGRRYLR